MEKLFVLFAVMVSVLTIGGIMETSATTDHVYVTYGSPRFFYIDSEHDNANNINIMLSTSVISEGDLDPGVVGAQLEMRLIAPNGNIGDVRYSAVVDFTEQAGAYRVIFNESVPLEWFSQYSTPPNSPLGAYNEYIPIEIGVRVRRVTSDLWYSIDQIETQTYIAAKSGPTGQYDFHEMNGGAYNTGVTFGMTYRNEAFAGDGHLHFAAEYNDYDYNDYITSSKQFTSRQGTYMLVHYAFDPNIQTVGGSAARRIHLQRWDNSGTSLPDYRRLSWQDVMRWQGSDSTIFTTPSQMDARYFNAFFFVPVRGSDNQFLDKVPYMRRVFDNGRFLYREMDSAALNTFASGIGLGIWYAEMDYGDGLMFPDTQIPSRSNGIVIDGEPQGIYTSFASPPQLPFATAISELNLLNREPAQDFSMRIELDLPPDTYTEAHVWDFSYGYQPLNFESYDPTSRFRLTSTVNRNFFPNIRDETYPDTFFVVPVMVEYTNIETTGFEDRLYPIRDMYPYRIARPGHFASPDSPSQDTALPVFLSFIGLNTIAGYIGFTSMFLIVIAHTLIIVGMPPIGVAMCMLVGIIMFTSILNLPIWFPIIGVAILVAGMTSVIKYGGDAA